MLMPFEKRRETREPFQDQCLFSWGEKTAHLRLRDTSPKGVGAYCRDTFESGSRGMLLAKLPQLDHTIRMEVEVRWCMPCDEKEYKTYPYRVGMILVDTAKKAAVSTTVTPEPADRYRVKGSLLVDFAKVIRGNHDKPWQKYLTMDDMKIIMDMIIPSAWYPLATFRHAGLAVYEVLGHGRPEAARKWGRDQADRIPEQMYKQFFDKGDPKAAILNYMNVNSRMLDFLRLKSRPEGEREVRISLAGELDIKKDFPEIELLGLILAGSCENIAEKNGARQARSRVVEPSETEALALNVSWS